MKSPLARRIILGTLVFLAPVSVSQADSDLKDTIFRDCPASLSSFEKLSGAEKQALIPFFREVLKLKIDPLAALPAKLGPAVPGTEVDMGNIWRSFSPDRELDAKRCALQLLAKAKDLAAAALPEILEAASEPTAADDFIMLTDAAVFEIGSSIDGEAPKNTIMAAIQHQDVLGDNVLAFYSLAPSLPVLWEHVSNSENKDRIALIALLRWLSPSGQEIQNSLLGNAEFLAQHSHVAADILSHVRCPNARTARYIRDLTNSSVADIQRQALEASRTLTANFLEEESCPLSADSISGSDWLNILLEDLQPADPREMERFKIFLPLLAGRHNPRIDAILRAALQTPLPTTNGLQDDTAVIALVTLGNPGRDLALEMLKGKNVPARRRASFALASMNLDDAKKLRPFVPFLSDSDQAVRMDVFRAIKPVAKDLRSDLRSLLAATPPKAAAYVALALNYAGAATSASQNAALLAIPEQPCDTVSYFISALDQKNPKVKKVLSDKADSCLAKGSSAACHAIGWSSEDSALLAKVSEKVAAHFDAQNPTCILNAFQSPILRDKLKLSSDALAPLLASTDDDIFTSTLKIALDNGNDGLLATVRDLAAAKETSTTRRKKILAALARSNNNAQFWSDLFAAALENGTTDQLAPLGCTAVPAAVEALTQMEKRATAIQKPAVIRLMGVVGAKSSSFTATLTDLLGQKDLETRYQALVALLRTEQHPEIYLSQAEEILKSRKARALSEEHLPATAIAALLTLDPQASALQNRLVEVLRIGRNSQDKVAAAQCEH
ncbi:MAG: hypothetical protein J0M12_12455 [Deltaproteobacteria bacterium]|nr:hypothetical protein [Deltaproteobacteria bacterium]